MHGFGQGGWRAQVSVQRADANLGHRVDRTDAHQRHRADLEYVGGFADQEVHVFGHDYVSVDMHGETAAHFFQGEDKQITGVRGVELGLTVITAEREEVRLRRVVKAPEILRHEGNLHPGGGEFCDSWTRFAVSVGAPGSRPSFGR